MKQLLILFSHKLTESQVKDAMENHGINSILTLPEELQKIWSNVDPHSDNKEPLNKIYEFILKTLNPSDYALIQGEWGYVYDSINFCKINNIIPVYATTERVVSEVTKEDGTIEKLSIFKHVKFKKY